MLHNDMMSFFPRNVPKGKQERLVLLTRGTTYIAQNQVNGAKLHFNSLMFYGYCT